jgi:alpha-galactosidase
MSDRIVLIGAGSVQFGLGTLGDILQCKALEGCTICLHDIDSQALKIVEDKARRYIEDHDLPHVLLATTDRKEAIDGATFCVISIEVGDRFALWEQDWRVPQQYGIRQVYGENGGPGGLFHALRIIPPILEICEDIRKICPEAYVFNFSNPMSRICTTVHRKYPDLRFIGLCHEIKSLKQHLPRILKTPLSDILFRAGGLNHFSILLEVKYRGSGKDAYPDVRARAPAYFKDMWNLEGIAGNLKEAGSTSGSEPVMARNGPVMARNGPVMARNGPVMARNGPALRKGSRDWSERGLFKLILEKFGYLPITTDSHLGEYIHWAYEVVDHKGILDFFNWYKSYCSQKRTYSIQTDHYEEQIVPIIEGILTDAGEEEAAVNLPNRGPLIDNLPEYLVVEVPAVVDRRGIHGIRLGSMPRGFVGLLSNQIAVHDLTAEAVLQQSRELALQALLVDPVVDSVRAAEQTLETILDLQEPYLGYLK